MPGKIRTKPNVKQELLFWGIIAFALALDLLSKYLAFNGTFDSIPTLSQTVMNPGVAFGIRAGGKIFLAITGLILTGMLIYFRYSTYIIKTDIVIAILIGGALGNIYDRLFFDGKVRDFIQWPTFNVADIWICAGVIWFIVDTVYKGKDEGGRRKDEVIQKEKKEEEAKTTKN